MNDEYIQLWNLNHKYLISYDNRKTIEKRQIVQILINLSLEHL